VNLFQDGKGKEAVPVIRLNVIRLLAELCVFLKKWEVVDMILPLFIEHLEEGDASSPSSLRLRVWNFASYSFTYFCLHFLFVFLATFHLNKKNLFWNSFG
jgi:hypothetical protein